MIIGAVAIDVDDVGKVVGVRDKGFCHEAMLPLKDAISLPTPSGRTTGHSDPAPGPAGEPAGTVAVGAERTRPSCVMK